MYIVHVVGLLNYKQNVLTSYVFGIKNNNCLELAEK